MCLIWGCVALVLRRWEAHAAPSRARRCLTTEECCRGHGASAFLSDAPHATRTHEKLQTLVFGELVFFLGGGLACVQRMQMQRQHPCWLYTAVTCGFPGGPGPLWEAWGLGLSFVKEPRGPCRGWLEHTWHFEPLGRSAGITPKWLWRLAVSRRLEKVCCCARCIGCGFGSYRGRKGFFRNQWGGWQGQRPWRAAEEGQGSKRDVQLGLERCYFWRFWLP